MALALRKITANLPDEELREAMRITGKGITPTLVEGLKEIRRRAQRSALRQLKGRIHIDVELAATRR